MPRKTEEQTNELKNEKKSTKKTTKPATTKTTTAKSTATKAKTASSKTTAAKPKNTSSKTASTKKKTTTTKSATSSKSTTSTAKKSATKSTKTSKKSATTKKATSKTTSKKSRTKRTTKPKVDIVEYYDLPYRYNQTVVKVLAQTPKTLFIYWDISDKDRKEYEKKYGENFFEITKPVLIVHNTTLGYSFEVEINDFANSWYLHVADSKCDYKIELGRKPIAKTEKVKEDYIYISTSNEIESPNDRILFNRNQKMVYFRDVKTGKQTSKDISSMSFIRNMGKIYNIYDLYKVLYNTENIEEIYNLSNPSSGNPSSGNPSSK